MGKKIGPKEASMRAMREGSDGITALLESVKKAQEEAVEQLKEKRSALEQEKKELTKSIDAQIDSIDDALGKLGIHATRAGTGTRQRRSREEIEAMASKVVDYIRKHPGTTAGQIKAAVGDYQAQSLSKWLEQYSGVKVKTEGNKATTKYSI